MVPGGSRLRAAGAMVAAAILASGLAAAVAQASVTAPRLHIRSIDDLPTPLPRPYDDNASAAMVNASIDQAFARARHSGKRVVIDLGGNWCGWCRILAAVMDLPEARPFIQEHFEVVSVEVTATRGETDRNLQVLRRFHLKDVEGYPWLIIADARGRVLNSSPDITDERHQTPQSMIDWLAKWSIETPRGERPMAAE